MDLKNKSEEFQNGFSEYHKDLIELLDETEKYRLNYRQFYKKVINLIAANGNKLEQISLR